jgi:branched-chain amino acid transport system substrate-binding protein
MGHGRFFRGDSTQLQMLTAYADFIYNKLGITKAAIYYVQSDWGVAVYDEFIGQFGKYGGEVVHSDMFALETKDFNASLARFAQIQDQYELFFLAGHITEASLIVNQMRRLGITKPLITNNSLQMQQYLDIVGENAEGQMLLSYFAESGNTERFEAFRQKFEQKTGNKVDTHAFNTTDLIQVMFEAMRHSGNDRDRFVEEMHKIKDFEGLQTKITMLSNGDMDKPFTPVIVKDGKFVVLSK